MIYLYDFNYYNSNYIKPKYNILSDFLKLVYKLLFIIFFFLYNFKICSCILCFYLNLSFVLNFFFIFLFYFLFLIYIIFNEFSII